jgi:hypothetical protein
MAPDIVQLLARGAHRPAGDLDEAALRRRGRRLRRRRQLTGGVAVVVLLLSVPAGVVGAHYWWPGQLTGGGPAVTAGSPTTGSPTTGTTRPPDAQVPPGREPGVLVPRPPGRDGGRVVLPVTFPDGTTAEVVYPVALDIAGLGVRPRSWGQLVGSEFDGCCQRDFFVWKDSDAGDRLGGRLIRQVSVVDGQPVTLWSASPDHGVERYLVFTFGSWRLAVWDGGGGPTMTDEQLLLWAEHLHGRTTPDGFLVLQAAGPLLLAGVDSELPPSLGFGQVDRRQLGLTPVTGCGKGSSEIKPEGPGQWLAEVCRPGQPIRIQAAGDRAFVDGIVNDLRIRNVRLAPHRDGWAVPPSAQRGGGTRP